MSNFKPAPSLVFHKLSDLFTEITAQVQRFDEVLAPYTEEQKNGWGSPKPYRDALARIADHIEGWLDDGIEYAVTDREFSDGSPVNSRPENLLTTKFGHVAFPARKQDDCQVKPVSPGQLAALKNAGFDL